MFVNRKNELKYLEGLYKEKGEKLLIVYGRRRIGKTELLKRFSMGKNHLFFSSDLSSEPNQLRQFTEKIYQTTGESFLQRQSFSSWEPLFMYIFDHLIDKIPLVIIDEFPYLCESNKALPSILQKIWDERAKDRNIFLVLCGSYMSFMEKEILGEKSPLFGRRIGQIFLQPLQFRDLKEFYPQYSREERVYSYAILGGTPAYLQRFNNRKSIEKNIKEEILNKNSFLYREPRFLLMEELRAPSLYFSILEAIAFGKTRLNEISQASGIENNSKVNKYLAVLSELHIIRRDIPVTEYKPHKSRKGIYIIEDPFFRFWFRYIFPNMSYLEEGDINYVWNKIIKPDINRFAGFIFEEISIQRLKELNKDNKLPFKAKRIGRWWNKEKEIDIIALDYKGSYLLCECKWTNRKIGINILNILQEKSNFLPKAKQKYFGFFSKSGFTKELKRIASKKDNILLLDY